MSATGMVKRVGRINWSFIPLFCLAGAVSGILNAVVDRYAPQIAPYTPSRISNLLGLYVK